MWNQQQTAAYYSCDRHSGCHGMSRPKAVRLPCAQGQDKRDVLYFIEYVCCAGNVRSLHYSTSPFCARHVFLGCLRFWQQTVAERAICLSPLLSISFSIHYSFTILPCNFILTELAIASLNKQICSFHASLKLGLSPQEIFWSQIRLDGSCT